MSFPCYEQYADSGKEWLGMVPKHWDVTPLKYVASLKGRLGWQGLRADEYTEDGPFLVTSEHFRNEAIDWGRCYHVSPERYALAPEIHLRSDDLLMMKDGAAMGKLAYVESVPGPACLNSHLLLFRPLNGRFTNRFLFYLLGGPSFKIYMTRERTGTTFFGISQESIGAFSVALPPIDEQYMILGFLGREISKIDALIGEQQRLISLLKEKRHSVISQAVTKGLNPRVAMKESGLEWLGKVPQHWEVKAMRNVADVVRGASPRPAGDPLYFGGDAVPWVTVAEITKDELIELTDTETLLTEEGAKQSNLFRNGTLIYSNSGATLGVPKILGIDACANDGVIAFERLCPTVHLHFLYHFLASITEAIREKVKQGSGQPNLNTDIVKGLRFALPPMDEQELIVRHIAQLTDQFSSLTAEVQSGIALLQERRTTLISAAVTGKIDVRSLMAVQPEEVDAE